MLLKKGTSVNAKDSQGRRAGVIERLARKDVEAAVTLFQHGLSMEIPPGSMSRDDIRQELLKTVCLVHKTRKVLDGIVNFRFNKSRNVKLMFVCSSRPGRSIGTGLLRSVAELGARNHAKWIYSGVSSEDDRAMGFYHDLGFRPYKKAGRFGYYIRAKPNEVISNARRWRSVPVKPRGAGGT